MQDMYSTIDEAVKLVVANKVDRSTEREVTFEQGAAFAKKVWTSMLHDQQEQEATLICPDCRHVSSAAPRACPSFRNAHDVCQLGKVPRVHSAGHALQNGTLFVETSAKANVAVSQAFEELVAKVLDTPSLLQVLTQPSKHCGNSRLFQTPHPRFQRPNSGSPLKA